MPIDQPDEIFYWVNQDDQVLGVVPRAEAHSGSHKIHRSIAVIITNQAGQMLLQQRSQSKDTYPGFWTLGVTGHVDYKETYFQTARREAQEELGLKLTKIEYLDKVTITLPHETEIVTIYHSPLELEPTNFDQTEVKQVKWVKLSQLETKVVQQLTPDAVKILKMTGYID